MRPLIVIAQGTNQRDSVSSGILIVSPELSPGVYGAYFSSSFPQGMGLLLLKQYAQRLESRMLVPSRIICT